MGIIAFRIILSAGVLLGVLISIQNKDLTFFFEVYKKLQSFPLVHFERSVTSQFHYLIITTVQAGCLLSLFLGNWLENFLDI
jgi:hypothetical protein